MTGKDGPRRHQIKKAYLDTTRPMQEIRSTDTVAFFRALGDTPVEGPAARYRSIRTREILDNCYYPHVTKEVRDRPRPPVPEEPEQS